ncbi:MAG: glycoside hydrolase family 104 protein [Cyanobacteriota bacterium]|nr:glycoside hydrolase family 104 protein [Cyanobacteriota bacterium]
MGSVVLLSALPMAPATRLASAEIPAPQVRTAVATPAQRSIPRARHLEPADDQAYAITPERRALLNTIRYAEGTWVGGSDDGYRVIYGGGRVDRLDRHPEITVRRTYVSAAAGAYQFLPATWREASRRLGLSDFGPQSQDQAALYLMEKRGALASFDSQGLTLDVLARLAPEWASLPAHHGGSYYGQPVKSAAELKQFYAGQLERLQRA